MSDNQEKFSKIEIFRTAMHEYVFERFPTDGNMANFKVVVNTDTLVNCLIHPIDIFSGAVNSQFLSAAKILGIDLTGDQHAELFIAKTIDDFCTKHNFLKISCGFSSQSSDAKPSLEYYISQK